MSFINSYSNVNATVSLSTLNLTAGNLIVSDASKIEIGGGTTGQVLSRGADSTLAWAVPISVPIAAPGSNTQVVYRNNTANTFTANAGLTFDKTTNTLSISNALTSTGSLTATGIVNLGSVSNITIPGGSAGQVLMSDGAGNVTWTSSPGSSTVVQNYITDPDIVTVTSYLAGQNNVLFLAPQSKLQFFQNGGRISLDGGNTYYTISSFTTQQNTPTRWAVDVFLSTGLLTNVPAGTACNLKENIPINTLITSGGIINISVNDSVLVMNSNYGFTSNGGILLNNNGSYAVSNNVRYYSNIQGPATANNQLVANADIIASGQVSVGNQIKVRKHTNNTVPSINFTNGSTSGILNPGANGVVNINAANVTVSGYTQSQAFISKPIKYAEFRKTSATNIPRSVYPTTWYSLSWEQVTNTTALTYSNNTWTNSSGGPVKVLVTYSVAWDGVGGDGQAKGTAILIGGDSAYGMYAPSVCNSGGSDPLRHIGTAMLDLAAGGTFTISCAQNTSDGSISVGAPNRNDQSYGGSVFITQLP